MRTDLGYTDCLVEKGYTAYETTQCVKDCTPLGECAKIVHMSYLSGKPTKTEIIKDIADQLEQCDWTTIRVAWEAVAEIVFAREKFHLTYWWLSYHIITTYDEKSQILHMSIYAPKKHKKTGRLTKDR